MGVFKDMLKSDETLFRNSVALDYDYVPKLVPYREKEQFRMAACIKPLLNNMNGRNLLLTGRPGVGKTVACRHVLEELEQETEEVANIYINCWHHNTTYKVILEICNIISYKFIQNRKAEELFDEIKKILNRRAAVFVFDEIDKAQDFDFLYWLLEGIHKKSIFLITNYKSWVVELDERIKSRLLAEITEFLPYSLKETEGILKERLNSAFYPNIFEEDAFKLVVNKAFEMQDIRSGLYLLKESANVAEEASSKKVTAAHAEKALLKLDEFTKHKKSDLDEECQEIYEFIKINSGKKLGDVFKVFQDKGSLLNYKAFYRKIKKIEDLGLIELEKTIGGAAGTSSVVYIPGEKPKEKTLSDF